MNKERKADLESKLVELEYEIWLAAKQGQIEKGRRPNALD